MNDREASAAEDRLRRPESPWSASGEQISEALGVDPERGLDTREAKRRAKRFGRNQLREAARASAWAILARQFSSLVIWLLIVACIVSFAFGHVLEGVAIAVVIVINALIGFVTELRAMRSMEALRQLGKATARVRRGGDVTEIPASDLVPGDVVVPDAGDVITADIRLIESAQLQTNESTLTGESTPVAKQEEPVEAEAPLAERASMLFKGTAVTRGSGHGVVVSIGMETELGRIAQLAEQAEQASTPLERRLDRLGRRLVWVTLAIAAITILTGVLRGRDWLIMIETGIALAVAAIPEGLPIVATLALARGMWRLARRRALINRLSTVETLGATNTILTDKTGTLTENRMTVARVALADADVRVQRGGAEDPFQSDGEPIDPQDRPALRAALEIGALCNNASLTKDDGEQTEEPARSQDAPDGEADDEGDAEPEDSGAPTGVGDPVEIALLAAGEQGGFDRSELLERYPESREVAFDPETRAMATYHEHEGRYRVAAKGAPERIIEACARQRVGKEDQSLSDNDRQRWLDRADELAGEGLRLLALAEKTVDSTDAEPYEDMTLLAVVGMQDPPRESVKPALATAVDAGVRVVMVTGDQAGTATSIAEALDLPQDPDSPVVTGRDLRPPEELSDDDRERLRRTGVFARVEPEQKLDLIALHQEAGDIVAMTGDGVNDAPALRKADIGVAMGRRGTQVAREASDMILQDDSFNSIVSAIRQGRVIFTNIRRFVLFLLSCNSSEILIVFIASIAGGPLPILPLQILFLNLVTDVFPALALGFGEGDEDVMRRPPRDPAEPIITGRLWVVIGLYGVLISVCVLGALYVCIETLEFETNRAVTVSFLSLALAQLWHVLNMRAPGSRLFRNDVARSPWIWGALGVCVLLLLGAVYIPIVSAALDTENPGLTGWGVALGASLIPLIVGQIALQTLGRRPRDR